MVDYKDWLSRFLSIYRYAYQKQVIEVALAEDFLTSSKFSQIALDEIWTHQVAQNISRDKAYREKKPYKSYPSSIYKYLKNKRYLDPINSASELQEREEDQRQQCPLCKHLEYFHVQNKKRLCSWHYSVEAEEVRKSLNLPIGPCNIELLRQNFIRNGYKRMPNEGHDSHIERLRTITRIKARTVGKIPDKRTEGNTEPVDDIQR